MSKFESAQSKGIAISFMLILHLFQTYSYQDIYVPYLYIRDTPLTFYMSLFADCCVVIFLYCSGYGLYYSYQRLGTAKQYMKTLPRRLKDLYIKYWVILILFCWILNPILNETRYPGNWLKILLNFTPVDTSYNGA